MSFSGGFSGISHVTPPVIVEVGVLWMSGVAWVCKLSVAAVTDWMGLVVISGLMQGLPQVMLGTVTS